MYSKIISYVMASYQELKNKLRNKNSSSIIDDDEDIEPINNTPLFEIEEARYLLRLIADNDFKGIDVQMVYGIALKLQEIIKNLKD